MIISHEQYGHLIVGDFTVERHADTVSFADAFAGRHVAGTLILSNNVTKQFYLYTVADADRGAQMLGNKFDIIECSDLPQALKDAVAESGPDDWIMSFCGSDDAWVRLTFPPSWTELSRPAYPPAH